MFNTIHSYFIVHPIAIQYHVGSKDTAENTCHMLLEKKILVY